MPRPKPEGPTMNFQFRLTAEETKRWEKIFEKAKNKNPYIDKTVVNRCLVGLDEDHDLVTEKDRIVFIGVPGKPKMLGRATPAKPHIKEVSKTNKRK